MSEKAIKKELFMLECEDGVESLSLRSNITWLIKRSCSVFKIGSMRLEVKVNYLEIVGKSLSNSG
jgi:hypothetical protein